MKFRLFTLFHYLNAHAFHSGLYGLNSKVELFLHFADLSPEEAEDVSFKQVNLQTCELCNSSI